MDQPKREGGPLARTAWLLGAFVLITGVGVVTVLLPELADEPEPPEAAQEAAIDETVQE